jgi:hypothetical protein
MDATRGPSSYCWRFRTDGPLPYGIHPRRLDLVALGSVNSDLARNVIGLFVCTKGLNSISCTKLYPTYCT